MMPLSDENKALTDRSAEASALRYCAASEGLTGALDRLLNAARAEAATTLERVGAQRDDTRDALGATEVQLHETVAALRGAEAQVEALTERYDRLLTNAADKVEALTKALTDVRAAIMEHAPDTLWVSLIETAVDSIDAALGQTEGHSSPAEESCAADKIRQSPLGAYLLAEAEAEESGDQQAVPDLTEPYRPQAVHYEAQDILEYVSRDAPNVLRSAEHPAVDILLDMKTREPIGWRIYGWSKVAPAESSEQPAKAWCDEVVVEFEPGDHQTVLRKDAEENSWRIVQDPAGCDPANNFADCAFKARGTLDACHDAGGCLDQVAEARSEQAEGDRG